MSKAYSNSSASATTPRSQTSDSSSRGTDAKPSRRRTNGKPRPSAASKKSAKRTPTPSPPLCNFDDFEVKDPEELRRLMQESLQTFAVELGIQMAACLLEDDVIKLCGKKSERLLERASYRHGTQPGYIVLGGQKVAVRRPRVRAVDGGEVGLDVYEQLQNEHAMPAAALAKMVRGVSCRDYEAVVETARAGFAVKKSSVSRNFVAASAEQLKLFDQRRFDGTAFAAIFIDGVAFGGEVMVVALGVDGDGKKHVLGLRQGETENAEVVAALLLDLHDRGIATDAPTLFCLDGAKALAAAVKRVFGRHAIIQRCQVHKIRNVESHLPKKHRREARKRMRRAYNKDDIEGARQELEATMNWLHTINRDAARSLAEGLDETLTVIELGLCGDLKRIFSSTNAIESMFSRVRDVTRRVKRWQGGEMRHRWCVAGLLRAESGFRKIKSFRDLPELRDALNRVVLANSDDTK